MNINAIKKFRTAHEQAAGGNNERAHEAMNHQVTEWIKDGTLIPGRVSFRGLLESLTDFDFGKSGNSQNGAVKMSEAISGSAFPTLTNTILNSITMNQYDLYANNFLNLVTENDARTTEAEQVAGTTALGGLDRRLEKHAYTEDDFGEKDITVHKGDFGKIISLTFETLYNDETGMIFDRARTIGDIAGQHIHQTIIETMEGLPRTALEEVASKAFVLDGTAHAESAIYSADHTAIDGVVNNNAVTGGITEAGMESAFNAFGEMLDTRGNKIVIAPNGFIHHATKAITVRKLLATAQAIPDGNASAVTQQINPFGPAGGMGSDLNPISSPFCRSTYNYLGDFKKALVWLWVERPNTVVAPSDTSLAFSKRIVYRARFNYFGGCALRDYRYIVRLAS